MNRNLFLVITFKMSFQEVRRKMASDDDSVSSSYSFYPFSTSTLNDILGKFSELSLKNIILGYMFMVSIHHVSLLIFMYLKL